MSSLVGYYRYKIKVTEDQTVTLYSNGIEKATACIKALDFCENSVYVKYLDLQGRYRFYAFSEKWTSSNNPTAIGSYENIVTGLSESLSATRNIGYNNTETLTLAAMVSSDDRARLSELLISPRVYLRVDGNWILCDNVTGDNRSRNSDLSESKFTLNVSYARHTITKI